MIFKTHMTDAHARICSHPPTPHKEIPSLRSEAAQTQKPPKSPGDCPQL